MSRLFAGSAARSRDRAYRAAERLRGLTLSPIKDVELQASRIPGVVSLAQGIPSFDTPEPIKRFAIARMQEGACARYSVSPGLPALREAIAESLAADGMPYDAERTRNRTSRSYPSARSLPSRFSAPRSPSASPWAPAGTSTA